MCLAASLVERDGFDEHDQITRYIRWRRDGSMSSRPGPAFDIGIATSAALRRFEQTGDPYAGSSDPKSAGNGSLMRLAPVPRTALKRSKIAQQTVSFGGRPIGQTSAERERVRLGTGLEEGDRQRPVADVVVLANELVEAAVPENAVSVGVDVDAV